MAQVFDLKKFRTERKISQKELAAKLGCAQSFLSAVEHGKRVLPTNMIDELEKAYGFDNIDDYMVEREEKPSVAPGTVTDSDIDNAVVNSPGGTVLVNEFGDKLSKEDMLKMLKITKDTVDSEVAKHDAACSTAAPAEDQTKLGTLIELLSSAEKRYQEMKEKADNMERENNILRAKLEAYESKK